MLKINTVFALVSLVTSCDTESNAKLIDAAKPDKGTSSHNHESTSNKIKEGISDEIFREGKVKIFGLVIDQEEATVADAVIEYSTKRAPRIIGNIVDENIQRGLANSRSDGTFEIADERAMNIDVTNIRKEGMRWVPSRGRMFCEFAPAVAEMPITHESPLLFMLVSEEKAMPKCVKRTAMFSWNGEPAHVALDDTENELHLVFKRNRIAGQRERFDWAMELSIEGGGIQELHAEGPMLAPIDGYKKSISYGSAHDDADWVSGIGSDVLQVYRTSTGEYGTLQLFFYPSREEDLDSAKVIIYHNPTGERYLR